MTEHHNPIHHLRQHYEKHELTEQHAGKDPFQLFDQWFHEAGQEGHREPNAMVLSTVSAGRPRSRVLLLKSYGTDGFIFYTNYNSAKGSEMSENPYASLNFWWEHMERQVRIEGRVEKVPEAESEAYYRVRPRGSQLGAWASRQSSEIASREELAEKIKELEMEYHGAEVPRPAHWGGYRLVPDMIEFWQGRPNRLHDRLEYRLENNVWVRRRLSP